MTPFIIAAILVFIIIALVYADKKKIKTKAEAGIKFIPIPAPSKPQLSPVKIIRENELPHKCCGGGKCGVKPYDPVSAANAASDALDAEVDEIIGFVPTAEKVPTVRKEKDRFVTVDEIRHTAYLIAAGDNFQKDPSHYWCEAEKQLKEQI